MICKSPVHFAAIGRRARQGNMAGLVRSCPSGVAAENLSDRPRLAFSLSVARRVQLRATASAFRPFPSWIAVQSCPGPKLADRYDGRPSYQGVQADVLRSTPQYLGVHINSSYGMLRALCDPPTRQSVGGWRTRRGSEPRSGAKVQVTRDGVCAMCGSSLA